MQRDSPRNESPFARGERVPEAPFQNAATTPLPADRLRPDAAPGGPVQFGSGASTAAGGPGPKRMALAIAALAVGILAFLIGFLPFLGFLAGGAAIALGIIALRARQSRPLALSGLVLGSLAALTSLVLTMGLFMMPRSSTPAETVVITETAAPATSAAPVATPTPSPTAEPEPTAAPTEAAPPPPPATTESAPQEQAAEQEQSDPQDGSNPQQFYAPAQEPAPEPEPAQEQPVSAYYANCDEAKAAGAAPLYAGEPGYRPGLDRDGDGVACEK